MFRHSQVCRKIERKDADRGLTNTIESPRTQPEARSDLCRPVSPIRAVPEPSRCSEATAINLCGRRQYGQVGPLKTAEPEEDVTPAE